jgi:hypothetical protein
VWLATRPIVWANGLGERSVSRDERPHRGVWWLLTRPFAKVAGARGWRWRVLVVAELFAAIVCGVVVWWLTGGVGLPDIGEPFDDESVVARPVLSKSNAGVLWEQALAHYTAPPAIKATNSRNQRYIQSHTDPGADAWLDANREAVSLFLEGSARDDYVIFPEPPPDPERRRVPRYNVNVLVLPTLLEGDRRAARGDLEGAWSCYRAVFRYCRLIGYGGPMSMRGFAGRQRSDALRRLSTWGDDPRTSSDLLRKALADVLALEAITPDDGAAVRGIYREVMGQLNRPNSTLSRFETGLPAGPNDWPIVRLAQEWFHPYRRAREHEPERSKRAVKLLTAQWLAYFAEVPFDRPPPAARVSYLTPWGTYSIDVYEPPPSAPAPARAASAWSVGQAFSRCLDARYPMVEFWTEMKVTRHKETADQAAALLTIAGCLYSRDHAGDFPPSPEALVGPYLKVMPDDGEPISAADDPTPVIDGKL